jgi:serine/threonine protein kinase/CheY-like chemotaxis protein
MGYIICADDDPLVRSIYQRVLPSTGNQVDVYSDGDEALGAFSLCPADMLVLDVAMPRLSGLEVCAEIRRRPEHAKVAILLVSSRDTEAAIIEGLSHGADDYVVKPVRIPELVAKVTMALRKKQLEVDSDGSIRVGSVFAGKYEILRNIGSGGSSQVYVAKNIAARNAKEVALKIYDIPLAKRNDDSFQRRFLREAYEHSRLKHPNIAEFYDFGQHHGDYYMTMEFVEGSSVRDVVDSNDSLPFWELRQLADSILSAIEYLDKQDLIHRDIKPENIMAVLGGYKLLDFGLARTRHDHTLSLNNEFQCTPGFVSPEYVLGNELDSSCDLYSLGLTLWYCATGKLPIPGVEVLETLQNQLEFRPPPLHRECPQLPREFCKLVDDMIKKKPSTRPRLAVARKRLNAIA